METGGKESGAGMRRDRASQAGAATAATWPAPPGPPVSYQQYSYSSLNILFNEFFVKGLSLS
jgi:hypothetical protein